MTNLQNILQGFEPITLDKINRVKLLDRMDTKYMFHARSLNEVLSTLQKNYYALIVGGKNFSRYETTYFDTPGYDMYTKHHNGKLNRYKVRFRSYLDSNLIFFEIKFKSNKDRTIKSRIRLENTDLSITGEVRKLLERKTSYTAASLVPALQVNYNRITLVNKNMTERLTIDFGLNFSHDGQHVDVPDLIISEVKQERMQKSPFISTMQEKRIRNTSLSKYCLGVASIVNHVKINNFKPKVRYVNQILSSNA